MIDATKLDQMLEALRDAEDDKEMRKAAQSVLAEDPEHPEARLALWELMEEEEALEELGRLEAILEETKRRIGGAPSGLYDEHPLTETYGALLMHLAFGFHAKEDLERALDYAQTLVTFDDEGAFPGRTVLYRCLLDLQRYDRILEVLETDPLETPRGGARPGHRPLRDPGGLRREPGGPAERPVPGPEPPVPGVGPSGPAGGRGGAGSGPGGDPPPGGVPPDPLDGDGGAGQLPHPPHPDPGVPDQPTGGGRPGGAGGIPGRIPPEGPGGGPSGPRRPRGIRTRTRRSGTSGPWRS